MNSPAHAGDLVLITQVVLAERQGRDRGWWDQMADAYWPDSTVRLSWYRGDGAGFVEGSKAMALRGSTALHHSYAPVVHVRGPRALVELSVAMRISVAVDDVAADLVSHTRLNYRLERRDDQWRISSLDAIYEYTTLSAAEPSQVIDVPPGALETYRPSYALMAWVNALAGREISAEELGDDRPDEVAEFYASTLAWLDPEH